MSQQHEAVVVFTARSVERILREGGTQSWRLDRNHARQCNYAICTRNAHPGPNEVGAEGPSLEEHRSAFLIGKVRSVVDAFATENDKTWQGRHLIQFSQFALISIPNVWRGNRNPVGYRTMAELGIDPAMLKWEDTPTSAAASQLFPLVATPRASAATVAPLTMADAKRGLALTFNVPPEAIEITIRG